ncbi:MULTISPECIES: DUF6958 family protein [Sinorhizobium]|uniref:Uncharacterized protein n=2 Tax=Sinorhizobium TaxID=28105 RepID=A0A2S3YLA9_9HYPH|nr:MULTISPECIES: hypothetical protein [Sinorhizobium]ASY55116.1 hypothetical protein SS05631_c01570 [Sinorhizobium sp. CCBAU 05631]AUX75109.1 hypothetical protein NXT3_CH00503 [Sinorhizobium fredii]PDT41966.1 hypothetical protein CO656_09970 [Sinorhizobium sp. FG01]PDT53945.1 hypothetical protein CO664_01875 [Sinorhizobium sp. NG07B]POH28777.1 hypothetical protein ATY31_19715 [Sinorhizobium americanum]
MSKDNKIIIENVIRPGKTNAVDIDVYAAMKTALLTVIPSEAPGLTLAEIRARIFAHLPEEKFPGGRGVSWWSKTVQLDLEAKGAIVREKTRPIRLHRG